MNKKLITFGIVAFLALAIVTAGVIYSNSTRVDIIVNEALSVTSVSSNILTSYVGETVTQNITVTNNANVPLDNRVSFIEDLNPNTVTYTTDMPKIVTLAPNTATTFTVSYTSNTGSPVGVFNGTVILERI